MGQRTIKLNIKGMTCQGCADTISRSLKRGKGVVRVSIDWKAGSGLVVFDPEVTSGEMVLGNWVFQGPYSASLAS